MGAVMGPAGSILCPHPVREHRTDLCGVVADSKARASGVAGEKEVDQGGDILWGGKGSGGRVSDFGGRGGPQGKGWTKRRFFIILDTLLTSNIIFDAILKLSKTSFTVFY
jgi:hypothetical protein